MAVNRRIPTRVGSLSVANQGAGTPVVFWPSLFSDHRLYDRVVRRLGEGWRTISVDGPGFGRSDPPAGDVQPGRYADAVSDLLEPSRARTHRTRHPGRGGETVARMLGELASRTGISTVVRD